MIKKVPGWITLVSQLLIALIVMLCTYAFARNGKNLDEQNELVRGKADLQYVDKQDNSIKKIIEDAKLAEQEKDKSVLLLIKSMDRKIDILLTKK